MKGYVLCVEQYGTISDMNCTVPVENDMQCENITACPSLASLVALREQMTEYLTTKKTERDDAGYKATQELIRVVNRSLASFVSRLPQLEESALVVGSCAYGIEEATVFKKLEEVEKKRKAAIARNRALVLSQEKIERRLKASAFQASTMPIASAGIAQDRVELEGLLERKLRNLKKSHIVDLAAYSREVQLQLTGQWLNRIEELSKRVKSSRKQGLKLDDDVQYLKELLHFHTLIGRKRVGKVTRRGDLNRCDELIRHKTRLNILLEEATEHGTDFCQFARELLRSRFFLKRRVPMIDVLRVMYRIYISSEFS